MLTLEVQDEQNMVKSSRNENSQVKLVYSQGYEPGDAIVLRSTEVPVNLVIQLEDSMPPAFVYLSEEAFRFVVPHGEKRASYSPKSFVGEMHVITARVAFPEEIQAYKNLALNPYDQHDNSSCYPHASANAETRGESVFAARNAINGNTANDSHGEWPYESWGINGREDAEITVHLGRIVIIDKVVLTLRADFPHDNYWEQVTLNFPDGSSHTASLVKTHQPQVISLAPRNVDRITLSKLIKSEDPSPFPALTQIEVYGREDSRK